MTNDFWNDKFSLDQYFYGIHPNDFLRSTFGVLPEGGKVLCVAEGEGRNAVFLASQGFEVMAVDFSEVGRKKALQLAQEKNVELHYVLSPLESYDFGEEKWDAIVSIFCHLPIEIRQSVHEKAQRGLKKGGIYLIEAYNPQQLHYKTGGPQSLDMLYTVELLKNDFSSLSWIKLQNSLRDIQEGLGHSGMSSVVHGVGLKL